MMNNIRLFEPVFNDTFESMFRHFLAPTWFEAEADQLEIRIDVSEKNGSFIVQADLPGVSKEDISVMVDGNLVQIEAEVKRNEDSKNESGKMITSERHCGKVSRTFTLAQDVDDAMATASYEDGVLSLDLPKKTTSTSKQLQIH